MAGGWDFQQNREGLVIGCWYVLAGSFSSQEKKRKKRQITFHLLLLLLNKLLA